MPAPSHTLYSHRSDDKAPPPPQQTETTPNVLEPHPQLPAPTVVGDAVVDDEVDVLQKVLLGKVA